MYKNLIAIFLSCVMLVSISPAVAAEDATVKPTIEEILNEYHRKAFEAESGDTEGTAANYSRSSSSGDDSLAQETVDTLNAAGYEAYSLTPANYDTLETELKTDFSSMGLDPNGSYIVVISGEDTDSSSNPNARGGARPDQDIFDDDGGAPTSFEYTYEGKTYWMRYVTITPIDMDELGLISDPIDLLDEYGSDDLAASLDVPINIFSSLGLIPYTGTLWSLIFSPILNADSIESRELEYTGKTNWTITYTEVYDFSDSKWIQRAAIEYVTMSYDIIHRYYDPSKNRIVTDVIDGIYGITYSQEYNNKEHMKSLAVLAIEHDSCWLDEVTYVEYKFAKKTIITHYRPFPELYQ